MKLYTYAASPNSFKVVAVLNHLGLAGQVQILDLISRPELKPELKVLYPGERTPTLVDGDFVLWESNAIMQYLAAGVPGQTIWPSDRRGQADVSRWQCWQLAHWGRACGTLIYERLLKAMFKLGTPDETAIAEGEKDFREYAEVLDHCLKGRKWIVGDKLTLADFSVGAAMVYAQPARYPLEGFGEISRWFAQFGELEGWRKALPPPRPA
ncbi:MAG: glutathione S-transferase family protein [Candidatus Wallbacteria bacterium]|nr:glutathione S-transferase family protein [Candidatus Wallbacteria bacterium]